MEFLSGVELSQMAGVILDFGFVGALLAVVLFILAKSPFSLQINFEGNFSIGKNGKHNDSADEHTPIGE